jgi:hypothetical protein
MTSGQTLDVYAYIDYVNEHKEFFDLYANLDVIGSAEGTWKNQRIMEKAGLNPLPVYHINEDPKFLAMAMEYDYFAVGGMARSSSASLQFQVDEIFSIICPKSNDYFPTHKIHGFGTTKPSIMVSYPWYSVDSSSWVKYGLYGIVLIPRFFHGKPTYNKPPMTVVMSNRSKAIGDQLHFANISAMEKEAILNYFAEKGISIGESYIVNVEAGHELLDNEVWINKEKTKVEQICEYGLINNHVARDHANLLYFLDLEKFQQKWPWQWKKKSGRLDI